MENETYYKVVYYDPRGAWRECTEQFASLDEARRYARKNFDKFRIYRYTELLVMASGELSKG